MPEVGPNFLKERFPKLSGSPEVASAARRTEKRTGIKLQEPGDRIQNYLDSFSQIVQRTDPEKKARGIKALKKVLTDRFVVRVEDVPESHWMSQQAILRSRGEAGDWMELDADEEQKRKQKHLEVFKEDQKGSLEEWIDYLADNRSSYLPDYLKYWAFQGMLKLEPYEKGEKDETGARTKAGRFPERPSGKNRSLNKFPEVNENGLKFIASTYKAIMEGRPVYWGHNTDDIPKSARQGFLDSLNREDFRTAYGWVQEYIPPITDAELQNTAGEWVTYPQGSAPKAVSDTLSGKGTGWCIAGESVAGDYLKRGTLTIYYTPDKDNNLNIPRVVIVSQGGRVKEVRGIEWEENIDDYIKETDVITNKLGEIPGGAGFLPTDADTKRLTKIEKKQKNGDELDADDLAFLYELAGPIKYFGFQKDPRIRELRNFRNPDEDMFTIFDCTEDQIARNAGEINENTKAFVGNLTDGIFPLLQQYGIEYVYTSFPEGQVRFDHVTIGGKTKEELIKEMKGNGIHFEGEEVAMIENKEFLVQEEQEVIDLVRLSTRDLGFTGFYRLKEVFKKAKELGLELCPAEVGPHMRLSYVDQPMLEQLNIGMQPIGDSSNKPSIFNLVSWHDGLDIGGAIGDPESRWGMDRMFVFRLPSHPPATSHV